MLGFKCERVFPESATFPCTLLHTTVGAKVLTSDVDQGRRLKRQTNLTLYQNQNVQFALFCFYSYTTLRFAV